MSNTWIYEAAFARNTGLINQQEQDALRTSRVAIVGMGGIGGIDLVTLARLGVGRFTIADPDVFDVANMNRQYGAAQSTLGKSKVEVMAGIVRDINPEADIRVFKEPLGKHNAAQFLEGADLFVDAIEFFEIDVRRLLFKMAAAQGIYGITAGPVGFSGIWLTFSPNGMSFDRYFDMSDEMDRNEKIIAFAVGVAPRAMQRAYLDMNAVDLERRIGPSSSIACHAAAAGMAAEAVKILLKRGMVRPVPYYRQFDPYLGRFAKGYMPGGNRHPLQRLKRWYMRRLFASRMIKQQ